MSVAVVADAIDEPDEAFSVTLSDPVGVIIGAGSALGLILDDDEPPVRGGGATGSTGAAPGSGSPGPTAGTSGSPVPAGPSPATPASPDNTAPGGVDRTRPKVSLTGLKVHRSRYLRIRVQCPTTEQTCKGQASVFSVAVRASRVKVLRREVRLGTATYSLRRGAAATLTIKVTRAGLLRLRAVKRLKVRAYGVTTDAAGNVGVRSLSATLRR